MKKINANNIIRAVVLGVFVIGASLFLGNKVNASYPVIFGQTQQDRENRFLTNAGNIFNGSLGGIALPVLELAPKSDNNSINISNSDLVGLTGFLGSTSINYALRQYGTAIFDNIAVYQNAVIDNVFAGFQSIADSTNSDARLQVNGQIQIESLADPLAVGQRRLCTNDAGILSLCDNLIEPTEPTLVYNWNTVWGACSDSTPSTGSCTGNYHATQKVSVNNFVTDNTSPFNGEPSTVYDFAKENRSPFDWEPSTIYAFHDGFPGDQWPNSSSPYLGSEISGQYDACINTGLQAISPSSVAINNFDKSNQVWEYRYASFRGDVLSYVSPLYGAVGYEPEYYEHFTGPFDPDEPSDPNSICTTAVLTTYNFSEQELNTLHRAWEPINPFDPPTIACQGATPTACLANNGFDGDNCSWETTASDQSGSTQSGTTTCQDQNGNIVSDNLCTEPRPAASRAC